MMSSQNHTLQGAVSGRLLSMLTVRQQQSILPGQLLQPPANNPPIFPALSGLPQQQSPSNTTALDIQDIAKEALLLTQETLKREQDQATMQLPATAEALSSNTGKFIDIDEAVPLMFCCAGVSLIFQYHTVPHTFAQYSYLLIPTNSLPGGTGYFHYQQWL